MILIGCIACTVSGGIQPAFSVIFSKVINVFQLCSRDDQKKEIVIYCVIFISLGIASFFSYFIQVKK